MVCPNMDPAELLPTTPVHLENNRHVGLLDIVMINSFTISEEFDAAQS